MIKITIDKGLKHVWKKKMYNGTLVRIDGDDYMVVDIEPLNDDKFIVELNRTYSSVISGEDKVVVRMDRKYLNHRGKQMQKATAIRLRDEEHDEELIQLARSQAARNYQLRKILMKSYVDFKGRMEFGKALVSLKNGAEIQRLGWSDRYWKECNGGIKEYYERHVGDKFHVSERSIVPDDDDLMATDWLVREE